MNKSVFKKLPFTIEYSLKHGGYFVFGLGCFGEGETSLITTCEATAKSHLMDLCGEANPCDLPDHMGCTACISVADDY